MQYRIGRDAGGTKVAYGLFDADHALVDRFQHATPITADGPAFCDLVIESLHRLLQKNNIGVDSLQGIGICMPSFILFDEGYVCMTSAMVNNYIKDGLVPRADGKRYGPVHLGYLTAVCALKKVLSVRDTGVLISAGRKAKGQDPEALYNYFCSALDRALTDTAQSFDADAQREDLPRIALDLALRSYANQLACARILDILQSFGPAEHKKPKK